MVVMVNDPVTSESQIPYTPLPPETPPSDALSRPRRILIILFAVAGCLLNSGLVFGFSAIQPVLVNHGVFSEKCQDADGHNHASQPCAAQSQALTNMFTFGTCALNIVSLITGTILDKLGPRRTAMGACCLVSIGCLVFASGAPGVLGTWYYYIGFLLIAVFGPPFFSTTVSFGNLFPNCFGTILASCIGAMDASSAVFVFLSALYSSGVSFEYVFGCYACVPLAFALVAFILWPEEHIKRQGATPNPEEITSRPPPLYYTLQDTHKNVSEQLMSLEFWLAAYVVSVFYVLINFFIATANEQLAELATQSTSQLSAVFAMMLPAAGILCAPVVGLVPDKLGPLYSWTVLWSSCFAYNLLLCFVLPFWEGDAVAYATFAFLTFSRPLLFTCTATYVSHMFGMNTFGRVHGSIFTLAGFANASIAELKMISHSQGYQVANMGMFVLQVSAAVLPLMLFWRNRQQRKLEARHMPGTPTMLPTQSAELTPEKQRQNETTEKLKVPCLKN